MAYQKLSFRVKILALGPYFSLLFLAEYGENRSKNHIIKAVTTTAANVAIHTYKYIFVINIFLYINETFEIHVFQRAYNI